MFEVIIGKEGLTRSWQKDFPETTECVHCHGESRIGFVVFESQSKDAQEHEQFVYSLHSNDPKGEGYWLHDRCAVAVYFCKKCLNTTALYNQG
jgi:hypothetical protein